MKVELIGNVCKVTKEATDKKLYNESLLLHKVKLELIKQGYDVIKKRMWKDGHLMGDDTTQYIRSRNPKADNFIMVYDGDYALRLSIEDYNKGELNLRVSGNNIHDESFLERHIRG
jgi:hypothetical protein